MKHCLGMRSALAFASVMSFSLVSGPTLADTLDIFSLQNRPTLQDAGATVDLTAKLPLLSQQVIAAGCYVNANIDTGNTLPNLINSANEFNAIVDVLDTSDYHWNVKIGMPARTQMSLQELQRQWAPVEAQARELWTGAGTNAEIALLDARGSDLLEVASIVSSDITGQNLWPNGLLQSNAMQINMARRQQMLAQQISKSACLFVTGLGGETALTELAEATTDFEVSLFALYHGMPEVGIQEPPTSDIADAISHAIVRWHELKPMLATVDERDLETLVEINANVGRMAENLELVATLYREASKLSQ